MGGSATMRAGTRVNVEQASKRAIRKPTLLLIGEGRWRMGKRATRAPIRFRRGIDVGTHGRGRRSPDGGAHTHTSRVADGSGTPRGAGRAGRVADGSVVPGKWRDRLGWTGRASRTSRRMGWRAGWGTGAGPEGGDLRTETGAAGADPEETARQVPAFRRGIGVGTHGRGRRHQQHGKP